jgi:hypothetical protein
MGYSVVMRDHIHMYGRIEHHERRYAQHRWYEMQRAYLATELQQEIEMAS